MQKKLCYKWVLVVTERFNMAVNDFDAEKSFVTELVVTGTQCILKAYNDVYFALQETG